MIAIFCEELARLNFNPVSASATQLVFHDPTSVPIAKMQAIHDHLNPPPGVPTRRYSLVNVGAKVTLHKYNQNPRRVVTPGFGARSMDGWVAVLEYDLGDPGGVDGILNYLKKDRTNGLSAS